MTRHLPAISLLCVTLLLAALPGVARCQGERPRHDPNARARTIRQAPAAKPHRPERQKTEGVKRSAAKAARHVTRVGSVVGLNRQTLQQYVILHAHVWPEVLQQIRKSNIRNYSIFMGELDDGNLYLFSYFEYVGDDFEADMQAMAADPATRQWWKLTDPLQKRVKNTPAGDQWKTIEEVFHTD